MIKRRLIFAILLLLLTGQSAIAAMSARQIMEAVDDRDDGDNGISEMEMILIDKNGHERKRNIRRFMQDKGEDTRFIMFFQSPADVKDTGFLTYDYDEYEKDDDQWLYLPALKKTKRIASSDKSGSFMGSDFNYSDMTDKNLDAYQFKILKETEVRGDNCWLIEAVPQTRKEIEETGYEKSLVFVRQDNFVVVRAVHWTSEGGKIKYMDIPKLEQVDGIWVAREMTMTTKKAKKTQHKTILRFHDIRFNQDLDEGMFSIRRLEKGL
jgi:outer membrane lipoprotein-sorting protein